LAQDEDPEIPRAQTSAATHSLTALLIAQCGGTIEQWERRVSVSFCIDALRASVAQDEAAGRKTPHNDPTLRAELAMLIRAIDGLLTLGINAGVAVEKLIGLEVPERRVVLEPRPWTVPSQFAAPGGDPVVVPWEAGRELAWQVTSVEGP
jgi:hypothetical protein